jgi:predicted RNA-binding Zn-ribbon protein involved in translation (DUF1610 family)
MRWGGSADTRFGISDHLDENVTICYDPFVGLFDRRSEDNESMAQLGRDAFAQIKRQAEQAETDVTAGMSVVPVSQRPKAPCMNCGRSVVVGAKRCDGCGHTGFHWTCNSCGGIFVETRIGLMYCVRCKGFWR